MFNSRVIRWFDPLPVRVPDPSDASNAVFWTCQELGLLQPLFRTAT